LDKYVTSDNQGEINGGGERTQQVPRKEQVEIAVC